jgi:TetR/AcrR family transcriptional repressor of lmrAB and yxaGH operons
LFTKTAAALEANKFAKGCPIAAVTLDLDRKSEALRDVCREVFDHWVELIARGVNDVPQDERRPVAQLILATLEGGLILARARGGHAPLLESGNSLATVLEDRFPGRRRAGRA